MNHFNIGGPTGNEGCVYILTNPSFIEDWVKKAVVLNELPNLSISVMIPVEATNLTGEIEKKWKSNRIDVIKKEDAKHGYHGNRFTFAMLSDVYFRATPTAYLFQRLIHGVSTTIRNNYNLQQTTLN